METLINKSLCYVNLDVYNKYVISKNYILNEDEKAGVLIECALRGSNLDFLEYLLSDKKLKFYPENDFDRKNFIDVRKTMWEDLPYQS